MLKKRFKMLKLNIMPKKAVKAEANKPASSIEFFKKKTIKIINVKVMIKLKNVFKFSFPPEVSLNLFSIKPIKAGDRIVKSVR